SHHQGVKAPSQNTGLIGQKCKPGNRFSRLVLIGRGLDHKHIRVHCATLKQRPSTTEEQFHRVTAAIAAGKRPDPFRTRKLSPPAPMVLHPTEGGRGGRRPTKYKKRTHPHRSE